MNKKSVDKIFEFTKSKELMGVSLLDAQMFDFEYKKHSHEEYAIGVTKKGVQSFTCNGSSYNSSQNGIITFNPIDVHDGHSGLETGLKYEMLYVDYDLMNHLAKEICGGKFNTVYFNTIRYDSLVMNKLLDFFSEIKNKTNTKLDLESKFYDTMTSLLLRHGKFSKNPISFHKDNSIAGKACRFMRENAELNISLDDIASEVSLSPYHFSRLFKKSTSLSPHSYLNQCRVEIVKNRIKTDTSLSELALEAGFSDQSHMNRRFKEIYGLTPGQFKKTLI